MLQSGKKLYIIIDYRENTKNSIRIKNCETEKSEKHFELYLENLTQSKCTLMNRYRLLIVYVIISLWSYLVSSYRAKWNSGLRLANLEADKI
jgi:hypothetical protein